MPEFTPDATFMSRSELDEFLAIRSTFSPETQSYLDKADRQIPKTFLDRNALAERAQTGFADDIEAEGFSRTWVQDFFDMDPSGMDFDTLSEYVTGEKMAPQDFTTRIGELMSRTAAGGPEPVDTLKDLTPEQREALSDDDVRDLLAKSPKAALQSYEQMMTPQEEFAARRIALQNDPDKAIELLSKFGFEQQNNILAWARVARPELDEDDSLFETIERKLGFTFTENVPRQIRREFDSLAEVLDFDHNRMLHAYSNGNAIIRTMGDGLPFDDRGQWKSNAQRIEFRNRMAERLYQQRRDEIVNPSGTIASEDLRNAIWGAPALDEAAIRDEANKKAAEITERFAPLYEAQSSEIKRLIGVKNAYQTLAPKVKKDGNAVNYYGSAAVEVIADIGIFMALSAPTAGAGGYAYGYTRVQSDLELELMEGGVDPLAAKRISMTFAVPHAMVEKYAAVLFRPVKGSVSKIAAKGLEKSGLTKGTGLLGKFARRVAPDRVAEIQTGVLTSLTQSWPGIFAQNMKKVAIQRGIASLGEFGQEALQDAIEASSKSFAIEFADAHGLDHGKVWQEWWDGLGELFITMALVGAAPGVIDVPAAAIGSTAGFRNGELMELAEQGRDLPPAQLDERVTVESLAAYNSAGTAEGRRAILAAAGHEDLDAADRLYAKEAELHADKLADLQTVEREANAEAQRETEETDQLGARVPAEHQPAPTVAPAAPTAAAPAAAPTRAPLKHDVGVLRKLAAALNPEGDLLVFDSVDDILESDLFTDQDKAEIAEARGTGKKSALEGFRATLADGRSVTVLPLDGAPDQTAAVKKLYHEVFHDAVRRLGKAIFDGNGVFGNWNDVYALVGEARIRRVVPQFYFDKFDKAARKGQMTLDERDAKLAEEYTARVLERMETKAGGIGLKDNTLFQKIRSAARQYLGIKTADEMTNEALAALMRQAIRLNQDPKIAKQAEAQQIQIKRELEKSRGERPDFSVAPAPDTAEFKTWFGDSKVVDENGDPLVVYHGTRWDRDFNAFELEGLGSHFGTPKAANDRLNWFLEQAMEFGSWPEGMEERGEAVIDKFNSTMTADERKAAQDEIRQIFSEYQNHRVYTLYLSIKNPLVVEADTDWADADMVLELLENGDIPLERPEGMSDSQWNGQEGSEWIRDELKKLGYDGVKYRNTYEDIGSWSWIAFDETQIKSTQNRGTFDPADPRIDFSVEQDRLAELNPHLTVTDAGTPFATRNDAARVGTALSTAKGKNAVEHTNSSNISRDMVPLDVLAKQMAQIKRSTPGYGALPDAFFNETDPVKKADILVEWRKKNLIALHNAFPEDLRERATHWYDGANRIAHYLADTYGMTVSQAGAVLAALSPQKHWFHNVAQAEQVIDIWNHERTTVLGGEEFQAVFDQIADAATPTKNQLDSKTTQLAKTRLKNKVKRDRRKVMEQMNGKTVEQLYNEYVESGSASAKALLGFATRTIAQTRYGQTVSIIEPEGDPRGQMRNKPSKKNPTGAAASHTWGGGDEIAKAISVMLDGSAANISANLGEAHKVRSFYNNIVSPWSEHEDITGDTHAVAAEDLLPYGASAIPVKHNLGTGASSNSGVSGMYHITADAYRAAAKELGLLPRQLQSIVWEAIRGMYTAADKNKDFTKDREDVWKNNDEETARAILAGQTILRPSWADGADGSGEFTGGQAGDAGAAGQEAQSGRNLRFDGRRSSRLLDVGIPEIGSAEFEASKTGLTVQQAAGLDIGVAPEAEEQDLAARLQNLGLDFSIAPAHDTAEWKEWFGDSKVVDSDGDPLVVKHGTTHAFDAFDKSKANVNNDFGQGFYFTNDSGDASENYAGIGPDLTNRLETLEEQLIQQYEDDPEGFAEAEGFDPELEDRELEAAITAAAERRLVGDDVRTIEAYLSFQNPYVLGGDARQFIELEYETIEEDGEQVTDFDSEPTGPLWDFVEALEQELLDSDFADADAAAELRNEILERANYEAITLLGLDLIIRESPAFQDFTNDEGTMAGNEAYRAAIEAAGFDGIIDHTVSTKFRNMGLGQGTTHYIAFKSEQVKAIDNARPTADPRLDFSVAQQQDPGREASVRLAYVILSRKSVKIDKPSAMKYLDEHFPDLKNKDQVLAKSRAIARSLETRRPELISNVEQAYLAIRKMEIAEASRQKIDAEHGKLFVSGAVSEQQQQARQRSSDRKLASRLGMSPQEIKDNDLEIANLVKDLEEQERLQKIKPASEADETTEKGDDLEAIERSKAITAELLIEPTDKREAVQKFIDRVRAAIVGQDSTEREKVVDFRRTLQRLLYSAINQLNHGKAREDLMRHTRELDQFVRLDSLANQATNILSHAYQARLRQGRRTLEQDIGSILRKWASGQIPSRMRQDKRKLPAEFQQYLKAALIAFNMTGQEYELAMGALLDGSAYDKVPSDIDTTEFTQQQILQADALVRFGGLKFRGLADHVAAHQFLTSEIEQRLKAHQEAVELKKEQDRARRSWIMNILPDRGGQHPGSGFAKWVASTRDSLTKTLAMEERFEWMLQGSKDKPAGTLLRTFARRIFRQADKARLETIRHQEAFLESAKVIYGRDAESIVEDLLRPQDRYAEFSSSGLAALSKSQVMQQVATLQQQQYYESFLGSDDAVRRARAEKLPAMLDSLSDQDLEMLDWFREFYADQRDELSAVNLRVTGLPVLSPDELYMPVKMRAKGGLGETHIVVPIVPPSLTPRIPSTLDLDESAGVVDMFQNRAQSNAQYKHLAELHVEIRGVFADGKLQTAMEDALGKTFTTDTLNHFGDIFAGQGPIGNHYPGLTKLVSWFAIMKLGTNLRMLPRQATSFVAYAGSRVHTVNTSSETGVHGSMDGYKITVLDTFKWATAGVLTPEGWKAVKQIWKSEQFQARKRSGNTQILADVTANLDNPKWMRKFVRRGMYFNALGDFAGLAFSGQGIMRMIKADLMATGMSEAEAAAESMNQFWQIAELNQQSSAVTNQSVWQRQLGAPGKILGQFTSTPQQFLAKEVIQGMEILNGSGGNKALAAAKFLTSRKVLVNHVLLPGFYHGVNILIDSMQGDDFDDDEIELLIASMLIGPLSGWFIFGNVVAGMVDIFTTAALGTKPNRGQGGDLVPVSGITSDLAIPMAHVIYGLGSMLRGEEMEVEFEDALLHSLEGFIPLVREIRKFTDDE